MFHESFLFNPDGADLLQEKSAIKGIPIPPIKSILIVPRSLCMHLRVNCVGVPRLRMTDFARLQVQAMSPFSQFGSFVVRQGDWLQIWLWDIEIEMEFARKHGAHRWVVALPQSVYSKPVAEGVVWLKNPGAQGVEGQLWRNNLLIDSLWLEEFPTQEHWGTLRAQMPELNFLGWPKMLGDAPTEAFSVRQQRPWCRNLTPRARHRAPVRWDHVVPAFLVVATAGLTGWGAWLYSQKLAYEAILSEGVASQELRLVELEPLVQARQQTQQTLAWVNAVHGLVPAPAVNELLEELASILTRQGLVVREIEINPPTIQATLVAINGGEPRLTAVLGALENHPWFYDARFVDVSGGTGFKFSWRMRSSLPPIVDSKQGKQ